MAIALAQSPVFNSINGTGNTSVAANITVTAGNTILVFGTHDVGGGPTVSCSDSLNGSYGAAIESILDTGDSQQTYCFIKQNIATGGANTVTLTYTPNANFVGICVVEVSGAAAASLDQHIGQLQLTPTTATDAVSSSATATLNAQPALGVAFSNNSGGSGAPAAGTGWTDSGVTGIPFGGPNLASVESKRVTATTALTATFTAAGNTPHVTILVTLDEGAAPGPTISAHPTNQTVVYGTTATFNVSASGTGTLHYQWRKAGANVGTDSSSYTTPSTDMTYDGVFYDVVVTDDNGNTTSNLALLRVVIVPNVQWFRA